MNLDRSYIKLYFLIDRIIKGLSISFGCESEEGLKSGVEISPLLMGLSGNDLEFKKTLRLLP